MILRSYQSRLVEAAEKSLRKKGNTLLKAATGAGKTIMLADLARRIGGRTLILQHRQELVAQNRAKFESVNPGVRTSVIDASGRSWAGDAVFAMQQTLTRHLDELPQFDLVIVDEVHHVVARTYADIIDAATPPMLAGFTATPARGDKKSLRKYFDNMAGSVGIRELVGLGFLVPPRAFIVDVGVQARLSAIKTPSAFGDQREVEAVLDTVPINAEVVRHWQEKAADRQTVVFASTVKHAEDVCQTFIAAGVRAAVVTGAMPDRERREILAAFDRREIQVITNVAVLTEGWDSQPVSCVILLRQCSEQGPLIQMAGRGLRVVDPELYPGVVKSECVILDFGTSILTHGGLDQDDDGLQEQSLKAKGEGPVKECPTEYVSGMVLVYRFPDRNGNVGCGAELPVQTKTCPLCGFVFDRLDGKPEIKSVELTEVDILNRSPFRWIDLFGSDLVLMASGFEAWGAVVSPDGGDRWYALGKRSTERAVHVLAVTNRPCAMAAADDFLRRYETHDASKKSRRWMGEPATAKQLNILRSIGYDAPHDLLGQSAYTKYSAACHQNFQFSRALIERKLGVTP